jgi:hypothetical protein
MATGPGKYDKYSEPILKLSEADAVVLIVLGGKEGSGFEIVTVEDASMHAKVLRELPSMLIDIASAIKKSLSTH